MEASRLRRVAENERFIREANEEAELVAVDEAGRKAHLDSVEVEFHCACGRPECDDTIVMSVAEYLSVHEAPHRFVVAPGHDTPQIERVVERHGAYDVVEKKPGYR